MVNNLETTPIYKEKFRNLVTSSLKIVLKNVIGLRRKEFHLHRKEVPRDPDGRARVTTKGNCIDVRMS